VTVWLRSRWDDLKLAMMVLTRMPTGRGTLQPDATLARAVWAYPLAGALVCAIGALLFALAVLTHLPASVAAALAIGATLFASGALHEDGFADFCDGLGGGRERARKLEIMRDSRIGTYGALGLGLSLLLRWSALTTLAEPKLVFAAWIAAGALSRGAIAVPLALLPPARADGLGVRAASPPAWSSAAALTLAAVIAVCLLGLGALPLIVAVLATAIVVTWLARAQLGGQTGDVLGACALGAECLALVAASGRWL
jgi:adenosylcobinamide-GDP ribazoletransferase